MAIYTSKLVVVSVLVGKWKQHLHKIGCANQGSIAHVVLLWGENKKYMHQKRVCITKDDNVRKKSVFPLAMTKCIQGMEN